jgi:hypothetical protein
VAADGAVHRLHDLQQGDLRRGRASRKPPLGPFSDRSRPADTRGVRTFIR